LQEKRRKPVVAEMKARQAAKIRELARARRLGLRRHRLRRRSLVCSGTSDVLRAIAVTARLLVGQLDEVEQALLAARQTIGRADQ
jgi:sulfite reductase beta subunit-like hemoprotein